LLQTTLNHRRNKMNSLLKLLLISALLSISITTVAHAGSSELFPVAPVLFSMTHSHPLYEGQGTIQKINVKDNMIIIKQKNNITYKLENKALLKNHQEDEKVTFSFYHMRKYDVITAFNNPN